MAADWKVEDNPKDSLSVQQGVAGGHEPPATCVGDDSTASRGGALIQRTAEATTSDVSRQLRK
jgi:hypothetical protein